MEEVKSLQVIVKESGLEETKAQVLLDNFSDYFKLASEWEEKAKAVKVTDASQWAEMKMAREGRLFLRQKRIELDKTRKKLKEQSLRESRAIDGIANVLKAVIVPIEEYLGEQEHFIENQKKAEEEARRVEAERLLQEKEERERKEKEAEEKRIRAENERLRKEAEAKETAMIKEREEAARKLAKEQKAAEEKLRKEREERAKAIAEERDKAEAERVAAQKEQARIRKEAEVERKKAEDRARKEAEAKAKKEREELEARLVEERRLAAMVTCPKCGHKWSTIDE